MKKYLFIFDVDGTLVNSNSGVVDALEQTFSECFSMDIDRGKLFKVASNTFDFIVGEFVENIDDRLLKSAASRYHELYYGKYLNKIGLFSDVRETLEKLKPNAYLSTATNMTTSGAKKLLKELNISDLFDKIVGTSGFGTAKPNPHILYESIDEFGVSESNTFMIGDSLNDILAGKNAKVNTAAMIYSDRIPKTMEEVKPDKICRTFPDVLTLI